MSYSTWHTYGYGICVSDIREPSVERLQNLLAMAPVLQGAIREWLALCGISEPDYEDYMGFDQDYRLGLATILKEVILEAENVELEACDSFEGKDYLLFCPNYPWNWKNQRQLKTEADVADIFKKYIPVLTDEPIDIDYQSVENGG
ncbi:hypothetical protein [uncultured Acetatifactor sp.]|jgi:hypothetical protein|uniref:hypothetical protein n=1 Tax=uncultured Acetatifactor sp. TaxID=1671927 RepID=UPI00262AA543|nr:hypothetical protein [uncultured Acetatifactor sp.]